MDKPKPFGIQTPAHHSATVLLYEIREIIRIDDSLFQLVVGWRRLVEDVR
jgi:hypothetical protein